jgi:hypothetical protein
LSKLEAREKEGRKKRRDKFPCDPSNDLAFDQKMDFTNRKELGHVRAPVSCRRKLKAELVDRAIGDRPGLVNGDYIIMKLVSEEAKRVYANVVLRGLKGMHLLELSALRERKNTWKFCFYQAIVALLAKTQLR